MLSNPRTARRQLIHQKFRCEQKADRKASAHCSAQVVALVEVHPSHAVVLACGKFTSAISVVRHDIAQVGGEVVAVHICGGIFVLTT